MTRTKPKPIGANKDADRVLDMLPRDSKREPNAVVYIDAVGRLNILVVGGGWLGIDEKHLGYVQGDPHVLI